MSCSPIDKQLWSSDSWLLDNKSGKDVQRMPVENLKCVVPSSSLQLLEVIGRGSVGIVHKAEWCFHSGKVIVAARELPTGLLTKNESLCDEVIDRLNAMSDLRHTSIIQMFGVVSPVAAPTLLFEFAELGSLKSYLQHPPSDLTDRCAVTVTMLLEYAVQIAHGLLYLESQSFVHGDLAACNIMRTSAQQVKISDCGVAQLFVNDDVLKRHRIAWYAPETVESSVFSHATDCWMYAVVLWELFSLGADPWSFESQEQIAALLAEGQLLQRPTLCPQSVYGVMTQCWLKQPDERPRFGALINALNKVALPELTAGRDFSEPGKLAIKNGDVIIITRSGSELWEGQNKRTGRVGEFPEIVFSLRPLLAAQAENTAHTSGTTQASLSDVKSNSVKNASDQPLIDFGNLASPDDVPTKPSPFSNWTTFESTSDLPKAAEANAISSTDARIDQDGGNSEVNRDTGNYSESTTLVAREANTVTKSSSENFDSRRHGTLNPDRSISVDYDGVVDVSDSVLLLPAESQTSVSEPCSPAHVPGVDNPDLLVADDDERLMDENGSHGLCHSLPASNMSERLSWMTSASCENLNCGVTHASHELCGPAQFAEHLSKASSDSPMYVGAGNAPPVPPRDYPSRRHPSGDPSVPKSRTRQLHAEIHPIVQDGQRRSSTHYWLLPEKQRFEALPVPSGTHDELVSYVNVPNSRPGIVDRSSRKGTKSKPSLPPAAETSHAQVHDMLKKLDISVADRPLESMAEIQDQVDLIRADVGFDAVTFEESLSALSLNRWSVEEATQYIKIEHLFRLGIASREVCREVLIAYQWDLLKAASCLVDRQSTSADFTH